jgi:hypothetical protein
MADALVYAVLLLAVQSLVLKIGDAGIEALEGDPAVYLMGHLLLGVAVLLCRCLRGLPFCLLRW